MRSKLLNWLNRPKTMKFLLNIYRPLRASGIRVRYISDDYRHMVVTLTLKLSNKNFHGVHFGGSLYAMTDPFYLLMVSHQLGNDYVVWDKAAEIQYLKPGKGTVTATFELTEQQIQALKEQAKDGQRHLPQFTVQVHDEQNDVVAHVRKTLYVRKKA